MILFIYSNICIEVLNKETTFCKCESQLFVKISINVMLSFHFNRNTYLVVRIKFEVFASLILKKMENNPNMYELSNHLFEKM